METIKTMKEEISYKFNEEERQEILKRVLGDNKFSLFTYWDYRDKLSEEQILKIITEEDGLSDIEDEIYENNFDYIEDEILSIINQSLSEEEETDEELKEFLRDEIKYNWNFNFEDLFKNSSCRLRIDLETNEDFGFIPSMREKTGEYYKLLKQRFKGVITETDLNDEINEFVGSDYGKLSFFFKVSGENILKLREEYQKGQITLKKGLGCGLFNNYLGCGGILEIKTIKPIKLNIKNWTNKRNPEYNNGYYNLSLNLDKVSYGIQETYYLTGECWRELY